MKESPHYAGFYARCNGLARSKPMTAHTPNYNHTITSATFVTTTASALCVIMLAACGPQIASDTGESFSDTETSSDGGESSENLAHGETFCVDFIPNQTTCWVGWGINYAQVYLPCQVSDNVNAALWAPGVDATLDGWDELVVCHDLIGSDPNVLDVCLLGPDNVALVYSEGSWAPTVSALAGDYPEVEPPCVETCILGSEGCSCMFDGTCGLSLECVDDICEVCPIGSDGCWCYPDETCNTGLICGGFVCG